MTRDRAVSSRPPDRGPVVAPLVALAAPMLLGQCGQVLLQLVDTLFIGRLGAVPLAGAAVAGNFVTFALYVAAGAVGAVSPSIAQAHGAGDSATVARTARAALVLAAAVGGGMAVALSLVAWILPGLGQPPEVARAARTYLLLLAWSVPAGIVALALGQVAEAMNRPWPVFGFMAAAVALNTLLAWCLVFGRGGAPSMGLAGAGVATLVARWCQAAALAVWLFSEPRLSPPGADSALRSSTIRRLFVLGVPVAVQDVLEGGSFAVGAILLGWVGTEALAANMVTIGIASLAWMFPVSLAMATSVRVAQAAGAGDVATARRTGLAAIVVGIVVMGCCAVVYVGGGHRLARLFTDDERIAEMAGTLVIIAGVYQVSDAIQSVSLGALRGMLDNRVPMIANAVCYWALSLPTVWWLTFRCGWGAAGVWAGYLPWMVATGIFFLVRFLRLTRPPSGRAGGGPGSASGAIPARPATDADPQARVS